MANLGGGGAEEQARLKQYGFKANSSLVLNSDERRRDTDEPSGEPESLRASDRETRAAYEAMLNLIQQQLGGQPLSIICGAADEILAVLKNESVKNHEKKMEIEKLLSTVPNQVFDQLVAIGRRITDYQEGGDSLIDKASEDEGLDYDAGVALEFEADDDESDLDMVQEEIDEEDEDAAEPNKTGGVQVGVVINGKDAGRRTRQGKHES